MDVEVQGGGRLGSDAGGDGSSKGGDEQQLGKAILERRRRVTSFFYRMAGAKPSSTSTCTSPPSSPWHSCKYPRTHSFRKDYHHKGDRDFNPLLSDSSEASAADDVDVVIRGLKSNDQFFFEPAGGSRSVVDQERDHVVAANTIVPFEGSIAMAVDSILGFQGVSMAHDGAWGEGLGVDGGDDAVVLEDEQEEDFSFQVEIEDEDEDEDDDR
ncbi:hypothetical protein Cni_G16431 [Canna indica]|uniref:Uncharacterized protein n=1 Tax=Canna indica TaxID=4628 RepID=A0AAQ3KG19_9LILI|nr:hypothetical protein Cni_G16431 [Canna indica]